MKTLKIISATILLAVWSLSAFSQNQTDVIYLKNGTSVKGTITEQKPNEYIKLKTPDGKEATYKFDEVDKITHDGVVPGSVTTSGGKTLFMHTNESFRNWTYNEKQVRKMNSKELKEILMSANDLRVTQLYNNSKTLSAFGLVFAGAGGFMFGWALGAKNSPNGDGELNKGLFYGGLGVAITGLIMGGCADASLRNAMRRYNEVNTSKTSFNFGVFPVHGKTGYGIGMRRVF